MQTDEVEIYTYENQRWNVITGFSSIGKYSTMLITFNKFVEFLFQDFQLIEISGVTKRVKKSVLKKTVVYHLLYLNGQVIGK
jgi:hypothetical protein